jgi:FMN reductase
MTVVTSLVGNPRTPSKTADIAAIFVDEVARATGWQTRPGIELANLAVDIVTNNTPHLNDAHRETTAASVLVVASPTYQATYTGLLKLFLESAPSGGYAGQVVVPIMVAASDRHALAVRVHLTPLLEELGMRVVAPLFIVERDIDKLPEIATAWWSHNGPSLTALVTLGGPTT